MLIMHSIFGGRGGGKPDDEDNTPVLTEEERREEKKKAWVMRYARWAKMIDRRRLVMAAIRKMSRKDGIVLYSNEPPFFDFAIKKVGPWSKHYNVP